jgi:hypothetical protein
MQRSRIVQILNGEEEPLRGRKHWRGFSVRQDPLQGRTAHTKCGMYLLGPSLAAALPDGLFEHPAGVFSNQRRGIAKQSAPTMAVRIALFGASAESNARFETNVSRLTCVSKSDTTQKRERQRVDGHEQRLHRSVGLLILAKSTRSRFIPDHQQPRISRSPCSGTRGRRNSIADLSEARYSETRYRSIQPRKILGQLYPTRQKGIWSKLLSLKDKVAGDFTLARLEIDAALGRVT